MYCIGKLLQVIVLYRGQNTLGSLFDYALDILLGVCLKRIGFINEIAVLRTLIIIQFLTGIRSGCVGILFFNIFNLSCILIVIICIGSVVSVGSGSSMSLASPVFSSNLIRIRSSYAFGLLFFITLGSSVFSCRAEAVDMISNAKEKIVISFLL